VQQLVNEANNPAPAEQPAPPQYHHAFPPMQPMQPAPIANNPPPAPLVPFGPSLFALLTSFSMYPKLTSIGVGIAAGLMFLSQSWLFILGASALASISTGTFLFLRKEYYENKLVRLPRIGAIANNFDRRAFLEGEKAANSVSHYLLSYVRPLCWVKMSAFGAGMQDELKHHHHRFYMKKAR
jgi:hypothetical protein